MKKKLWKKRKVGWIVLMRWSTGRGFKWAEFGRGMYTKRDAQRIASFAGEYPRKAIKVEKIIRQIAV